MKSFDWVAYFRDQGYSDASNLAVGMDGTVYLLVQNKLIAKVWHRRLRNRVEMLQLFYSSLQNLTGTFQTPLIFDIHEMNGQIVTLEKFIEGTPLDELLRDRDVNEAYVQETMVTCLKFLASISPRKAFDQLLLADEITSPPWSRKIYRLIAKRLETSRSFLEKSVDSLSEILDQTDEFLKRRDSFPMCLVHGDLFGGNVMVDERFHPVGILDFGRLTTIGDPAFDAGITSGIVDMYGPNARQTSNALLAHFESELGHSRDSMLGYRAVYALLTSNVYSSNGSDGHFAWSVAQLNDKSIRTALQIG